MLPRVRAFPPAAPLPLRRSACLSAVAALLFLSACAAPAPAASPTARPTAAAGSSPASDPKPASGALTSAPAPARPASASAATAPSPSPALPSPSSSQVAPPPTPTPLAEVTPWMRTVHDTALYDAPTDPSNVFTRLPVGSFVEPMGKDLGRRILVYYTGDGQDRQPGEAWVNGQDLTPSGPPPFIASAQVGDSHSPAPEPGAPHRISDLAPPVVGAEEVAVVDGATGLMLYGKNPHGHLPPASTTKIDTALVALQHIHNLDQKVPITVNGWQMAQENGSSIMGLSPGEDVSYRTLLYGLLLPSGNDAANQLALSLAGSLSKYVGWMNDEIATLHLHDTHYVNPSGLDASGHYSSPYDLIMMARVAMRNPVFRTIVKTRSYDAEGFKLVPHNPLLGVYPGTDGVKTGSTDNAGKTIVVSVEHDGHQVYVSVMHTTDTLTDSTALYNWVWKAFAW